jgi:hypothetical protein
VIAGSGVAVGEGVCNGVIDGIGERENEGEASLISGEG